MKKPIRILAVSVLAVSVSLFVLSIGARISGIYINTTPSLPVGFYKVVDEPIVNGAYVSFCPPKNAVFDMARDRSYINRGNCPGGYGLLLKRVFAQSGDTVYIDQARHLCEETANLIEARTQIRAKWESEKGVVQGIQQQGADRATQTGSGSGRTGR